MTGPADDMERRFRDAAAGPPPPRRRKAKLSKYTVCLDEEDAALFDALALNTRRLMGRRVDKAELLRACIHELVGNQELLDAVQSRIR